MSSFPLHARLVITFRNYWTSGTGEGAGRQSDTRCHRDRRGLPAMPMSQVKGTLRETAERLAQAGVQGIDGEAVRRVFGGRVGDGDAGEPEPAAISLCEDAAISEDAAALLADSARHLFKRVASTAINEDGVASDRTLRTFEVAVPVVLVGQVAWTAPEPPDFDWIGLLDRICAATPAFGKGKADGYGRAIARAEADPEAQAPAAATGDAELSIPEGAFVLELTLTPRRHAVFSGRSATEGAHVTLPAPTGAALLGWCAQTAGYDAMSDPVAVFHSGAVSFGDARPVAPMETEEVVPVPRSFVAPKGQEKAATAGGVLDIALVRNGRPSDADDTQYEALKARLMSTGYALVSPRTGQRLRTAIADGRAATGQLFGLQHIVGGDGAAFTARIGIGAAVDREDARRIVNAFRGRTLHLGKARNTGYGGAFDCALRIATPDEELLPASFEGLLRVLALSDIAAVNRFGSPAPVLDPAELGLADARFDPQASVIRHRRFAPWNGALGCRDTERQVIEAGSVLAYRLKASERRQAVPRRQRVGAWQEAGFGAVWLDPLFLNRDGQIPDPPTSSRSISGQARLPAGTPKAEPDPARLCREEQALCAWAKAQPAAAQRTEV